jgi:NitT/TauT family transport system substrate-binding protein
VGIIEQAAWDRTVQVALQARNADGATVLTKEPDAQAFTNEYVTRALDLLRGEGVDVVGAGFTPQQVTLNPGGG